MVATKKNKRRQMSKKRKMRIQYGCSKRNKTLAQKGGSHFLKEFSNVKLPPVPPALIGPNWTSTNMGSNHYALNKYDNQVDRNPIQERSQINLSVNPWGKMWGGKKRILRKGKRSMRKGKQKGGAWIDKIMPSDLLNVGRYASYNAGNIYNGYNGYAPAVSPMPWQQPSLLKPV